MARYVLISFSDNNEADAFVAQWNEGKPEDSFSFIRAMWQKPTMFCQCVSTGKGDKGAFVRGKKYGWWVHSKCGKPTEAWASGHGWYASLGVNLLSKSDNAPEYRGDGVWGRTWDPEQLCWVDKEPYEHVQFELQNNFDQQVTTVDTYVKKESSEQRSSDSGAGQSAQPAQEEPRPEAIQVESQSSAGS